MARNSTRMVSLEFVRWRLGALWFWGSGGLALLLIVQSLAGMYGDRVQGVWGWALPNFVPTLSLMIGVFAGAALQEVTESDSMRVRKPFYKLALGLSAFHLLVLAIVLMIQPFAPSLQGKGANFDVMQLFDTSNLFLGPLQGLVSAVLAALFFSKSAESAPAQNGKATEAGGAEKAG